MRPSLPFCHDGKHGCPLSPKGTAFFLLTAVLLPAIISPITAQTLHVAPAELEADRIRRLVAPPTSRSPGLELRVFARGDTDVLPLAASQDRHRSRRIYHGNDAYYDGFRNSEIALTSGFWRLGYASTDADLYSGNRDTAQLYLDSLSDSIDINQVTHPRAEMNRTAAVRWRIAYESTLPRAPFPSDIMVALSWYRMQRVQLGRLSGDTEGERFFGTLSFLSTLGVPPSETRSHGLSLDAAVTLEPIHDWRISLSVENLFSRVWQRGLQDILAFMQTNTIEPDENGFLHGLPLVQGTIKRRDLDTDLRSRYELGLARAAGPTGALMLLRWDRNWRVGIGPVHRFGRDRRLWSLFWMDPFEWQVGLDSGSLRFQLGMSSLTPSTAHRAVLSLTWRIPLPSRI